MSKTHKVGSLEMGLVHLVAPIPQNVKHRIPGDAGKDCALDRRCIDLPVDLEHDIHGADLLDEGLCSSIEPEHLVIAFFFSLDLTRYGTCIISAAFREACTTLNGTDKFVLDHYLYRVQSLCIIHAYRT